MPEGVPVATAALNGAKRRYSADYKSPTNDTNLHKLQNHKAEIENAVLSKTLKDQ